MFPRALNQRSNLKKRLFCSNQRIFACRLPIDFFYFEDFRWSFFGKMIGQKATNTFIYNQFFMIIFEFRKNIHIFV